MKRTKLLIFLLLTMKISAQDIEGQPYLVVNQGAEQPDSVSPSQLLSTLVHSDRSVTFRYYNPEAKTVKLVSDCLLRKPDNSAFGGKTSTVRMHKEADGLWTYTTSPLTPEVYCYNYIVDGKRIHDPQNPDSTFVLLHQVSLLTVAGTPRTDLYVPVASDLKGRIDRVSYYSEQQDITRRVLVYVPNEKLCQSATDGRDLPVLYLFHGISGDELGWVEYGKAANILDNLMLQGKIRPMLVVMPDCNVVRRIQKGKRTNLLRNMFNYPALCAGGFEASFDELEDFVSSHYNASADPRYHAIAGLSSGARQTANIVNLQPDTFMTVGLFSPVLYRGQLPEQGVSSDLVPADDDDLLLAVESKPVFHIYIGKNDMFYRNGKRYYQRLQKRGIECTLYEAEGGHTWRSWREFLTEFLPTLFRQD